LIVANEVDLSFLEKRVNELRAQQTHAPLKSDGGGEHIRRHGSAISKGGSGARICRA
jgi:hypothetical protein